MNLRKLPKPDHKGNYWFGEPGSGTAALISPILSDAEFCGHYFLSLGEMGVVMEDHKLKPFATAQDAFAELKRRLR